MSATLSFCHNLPKGSRTFFAYPEIYFENRSSIFEFAISRSLRSLATLGLFLVLGAGVLHVFACTARCVAQSNMQPGAKKFIQRWLITTLAVLVAVNVLPGLHFTDNNLWTPFVTSLILGILNAFIRPIMMFMALPLLIFTLGLFTLVINALLLAFVGWLLPTFEVNSFGWAFLGSLIISIISVALNILTGSSSGRFTVRRPGGPPPSDRGGGPVIDV